MRRYSALCNCILTIDMVLILIIVNIQMKIGVVEIQQRIYIENSFFYPFGLFFDKHQVPTRRIRMFLSMSRVPAQK